MKVHAFRSQTRAYLLVVTLETITALTVLWYIIPTYRLLWSSFGHQITLPDNPLPLLAALVLFHCVYWYRLARVPLVIGWQNMFVSHLVLFMGRLSFICASAFFGLAIFRHLPSVDTAYDSTLMTVRVAATFLILFSIYCYSTELERLGAALRPPA